MIRQFVLSGQIGAANASVAMIVMNLFCQAGIVYAQNSRRPWRVIALELFYVFIFVKPGIDAYRIVNLDRQWKDPALNLDPLAENAFTKVSEMLLEAVPSAVLQSAIIIMGGRYTVAAVLSIVLSALSTGYTSSSMSFEYDTSVVKRKQSPALFGE